MQLSHTGSHLGRDISILNLVFLSYKKLYEILKNIQVHILTTKKSFQPKIYDAIIY